MDEPNVKICPQCRAEYYPHIERCSDCGVPLAWKETLERERAQREATAAVPPRDAVVLREGSFDAVMDYLTLLRDRGISCDVQPAGDCRPGDCSSRSALVVDRRQAEEAIRIIEDHYRRMHPELLDADRCAEQNQCPACGYTLGPEVTECAECGLTFGVQGEADRSE